MLKIQDKVVLDLNKLKAFSKYFGTNDTLLITEEGILNFSRNLVFPTKRVMEGYPIIFSGDFLKKLLKEKSGKVEVSFKVEWEKLKAFVLKDNPTDEWDREITDFSTQIVPNAVLEIPDRKGSKPVSASALQYLLMFSDYSICFSGDVAYAYSYLKPLLVRFPNPFKGLEGFVDRHNFKELKKFKSATLTWKKEGNTLYVFNGAIFFEKLEEPKKVDFPELPTEGWISVNPKLLFDALNETYTWGGPYKVCLENGLIKIETERYGERRTAKVPYYGKAEAKGFLLKTDFLTYLGPFKKLPMVELNFGEEFVFLRYQKLEAVFRKMLLENEEAERQPSYTFEG